MIEVPRAAIELAERFEGFHRVPKNTILAVRVPASARRVS